jgi:hypothetical protein
MLQNIYIYIYIIHARHQFNLKPDSHHMLTYEELTSNPLIHLKKQTFTNFPFFKKQELTCKFTPSMKTRLSKISDEHVFRRQVQK